MNILKEDRLFAVVFLVPKLFPPRSTYLSPSLSSPRVVRTAFYVNKTGEGGLEPKKATAKNTGLFQYAKLTTSDNILSEGRV